MLAPSSISALARILQTRHSPFMYTITALLSFSGCKIICIFCRFHSSILLSSVCAFSHPFSTSPLSSITALTHM